jgi:DNA-binding transcriptional ArsR family regulator
MPANAAVDRTLAALADPARRRVIELLLEGPMPAGELAAAQGMSAPAMSRHLRVLRTRGLVAAERGDPGDSRLHIYRLRRAPFARLRTWLDEVEAYWTEQLAAFKAHAERGRRGIKP